MRLEPFLPSETLRGQCRVVISGKERMLIEQHRGLIGYARDRVIVRMEKGFMTVTGQDLTLDEYGEGDLLLSGNIRGMEFSG